MSKLSNAEVNRILTEFVENNPDRELTENQIQTIIDLFNRLMNENINKNKNLAEQESLITDIAIGLTIKPEGETPEFIFRQHSDNKHLNYFDMFLANGETDKILKALAEHNIPTDVLRGLKRNQDFDAKIGNVRIFQKVAYDENGSISIEKFEIYKDGELIYEWIPYDEDEMEYDTEFEPEQVEIPVEQPKRKDGKPRKSTYVSTIMTSDDVVIEESYDRLGRRRLQYAAGTVINGIKVGGRLVKQK